MSTHTKTCAESSGGQNRRVVSYAGLGDCGVVERMTGRKLTMSVEIKGDSYI